MRPKTTCGTYDANGNRLSDANRTYAWDAENRLVGITDPSTGQQVSFAYDGLGRRVAIGTTVGGVSAVTYYGWCGMVLCEARDGQNSPLRRYVMEGEDTPSSNQHVYYGVDQLGSVRDALDATTGASLAHYDYEPYGAPLGRPTASVTDFRYAGLFYNQWSGLYLANHRAMDPTDGRWESRDPIGETGGVNLYAYVQGNPLSGADPLGLWTYSVGLSFSLSLGNYSVSGGIGIVVDGHGNIGYYTTGGTGAAAGSGGAFGTAGFSAAVSNAPSINDLSGLGGQGSVSVSAGGVSASADVGGGLTSGNQP